MTHRTVREDGTEDETIYPNAKDAIKAAHEGGFDVYLHADDCAVADPGRRCPCQPLLLKAPR